MRITVWPLYKFTKERKSEYYLGTLKYTLFCVVKTILYATGDARRENYIDLKDIISVNIFHALTDESVRKWCVIFSSDPHSHRNM